MDAFYASVEQRDQPELRGKPVLVGARSRRGVVTAASYEARPFGVHSAMSMALALRRCPRALVVPPRFQRYAEVSAQVFAILRKFTPLVEGLSLDEAFLDVTGSRALFGDGATIARKIKDAIREGTCLTASAGVAPSKFVAKIGSDLGKPDGLVVVPPEGVRQFLNPLPIERMWGVGAKTAPRLRRAGFHTLRDLAEAELARLAPLLGNQSAALSALARGEDERAVVPDRAPRSIGAETTFETDISESADLELRLLALSTRVAQRACRAAFVGKTVVVKLKYADFMLLSRRLTLPYPIADTDGIYRAARALLQRFERRYPVRLLGVALTELSRGARQLDLFEQPSTARRQRLEQVSSHILERFGAQSLQRGSLLGHKHGR